MWRAKEKNVVYKNKVRVDSGEARGIRTVSKPKLTVPTNLHSVTTRLPMLTTLSR